MTDATARALPRSVASGRAGPEAATSAAEASPAPSLEAIYREHMPFVWRVVRRLGVPFDAIEDAVHDVFLVVRRRLPELDAASDLRGWLFMITRGVVANDRRSRERRERRRDRASQPEPPLDPETLAAGAEAVRFVEAFLATLPDEQRIVFELIDIEGFTGPEAARASTTNLDTAYSRLRLARAAFARHFASVREGSRR
jgi:RNA polymerase sigma-70 factor, ECF subfamily